MNGKFSRGRVQQEIGNTLITAVTRARDVWRCLDELARQLLPWPLPELDLRPLGRKSEWKLNDQVFHWKAQNELFWLPPGANPFVSYAEEYPARRR